MGAPITRTQTSNWNGSQLAHLGKKFDIGWFKTPGWRNSQAEID
jgi:hypothetical protein